jgi:antitoxin component YwqK of YwqJK toxin-antitoxin module
VAFAQTKDLLLDENYKPVKKVADAFYIGSIEKKEQLWFRELYYVSSKAMASQTWFKDMDATTPHGDHIAFYFTHQLQEKGQYKDGKKDGVWLTYYGDGSLRDSLSYTAGFFKGSQFTFYSDGSLSDSMQFDGVGNGVHIGWYPDGYLAYAGLWTMDTVKKGRWKYYDEEGVLKGTEDYVDGKAQTRNCYDKNGSLVDTANCQTREAFFPGEMNGWRGFLSRNLNASVPIDNGAKNGKYTVIVRFDVEKDGSVNNILPITRHGYGMEAEVIRLMKKSPKWNPARMFGVPVRSFKIQPVTFIVSGY